jgi:hypothetical protein
MLVVALAGSAWGAVPEDVKKSDVMNAYTATIAADVKQAIASLVGGTGGASARDELVRNAQMKADGPGVSMATPAYLDAYADILANELLPLAQNPNLTVRLYAAIIAARVAQVANNTRLADTCQAFVNDKSDPVVLWGIRGARWVIPSLLKNPLAAKHTLLPAVVDAVKKHSEGVAAGWIAGDAYSALSLDGVNRKQITAAMFAGTIDPVQNLLAARLDRYKVEVPANTRSDQAGVSYLTDGTVWATQTPQQQTRTMQLLSDLISLAAQQLEAQAKNNNNTDVADLAQTINWTAKGISVAAGAANQPGIVSAVQPATIITRSTPVPQIMEAVNGVYPAIKASAKFSTVTEPPKIQGTKAAPAPATAPSELPPGTTVPPPPPPPPPPPVPAPTGGTGAPGPAGAPRPGGPGAATPPRPTPPAR